MPYLLTSNTCSVNSEPGLALQAWPYSATKFLWHWLYGYHCDVGTTPTTQTCQNYAIGLTAPSYVTGYMYWGDKEHPVWQNEPPTHHQVHTQLTHSTPIGYLGTHLDLPIIYIHTQCILVHQWLTSLPCFS